MSQEISFIQDSDLLPTNDAIEMGFTEGECDYLISILDKIPPIIRIDLAYIKIDAGLNIREENIGTPEEYPSNIEIPLFHSDIRTVIKHVRYINDTSEIRGLYYGEDKLRQHHVFNGRKISMRTSLGSVNDAIQYYFAGIPHANITKDDFVSAYNRIMRENEAFKEFIQTRTKHMELYLNRTGGGERTPLTFSLIRAIYRGIIVCGIDPFDFFSSIWGNLTHAIVLSLKTRDNTWLPNISLPQNIVMALMKLLAKHPLVYANIFTICHAGKNVRDTLSTYLNRIFIVEGSTFGTIFLTPETKLIKGLKAESSQMVNALPYYKHNPCASTS